MPVTRRLLNLVSLALLLGSVWAEPVVAQPPADAPASIETWRTDVPRAVVPDRTPVVPSPTTSAARLLSERLDHAGGYSAALAPVRGVQHARPEIWTACAPPTDRTRLYDVLRVYRL